MHLREMQDIGLNLRVTSNGRQGGRQYMEDVTVVHFEQSEDESEVLFSFFAIFDGHGGVHAANYAKKHLLDELKNQSGFWSEDDDSVLSAIKMAFLSTHHGMWREFGSWPKTSSGMPSTSGTTASIVLLRDTKIYIGHVGDSGIVLGYQDEDGSAPFKAMPLTLEHKPESPEELKRIEEDGGAVASKAGVQRVVWNRPKPGHQGPVRRSTPIDKVPFLAVARSLGDLWSYNFTNQKFVVSPEPDVSVHVLDPSKHRCIILGSDGLWNMLKPAEAVQIVQDVEIEMEEKVLHDVNVPANFWINPSITLVDIALQRWRMRTFKADNTSCITIMIDPPGLSKSVCLRNQRAINMRAIANRWRSARNLPLFRDEGSQTSESNTEIPKEAAKVDEHVEEEKSVLKESHNNQTCENKLSKNLVDSETEPVKKHHTPSSRKQMKKYRPLSSSKTNRLLNSSVCDVDGEGADVASETDHPLQETHQNQQSSSSPTARRLSMKQTISTTERTVASNITNQAETPTSLRSRKTRLSGQSSKPTEGAEPTCSSLRKKEESLTTQNQLTALVPCIWPDMSKDANSLRKSCRRKSKSDKASIEDRSEQDQNVIDLGSKNMERTRIKRSGLKRKLSASRCIQPSKRFKHSTRSTSKPMTRLHLNKVLRKY